MFIYALPDTPLVMITALTRFKNTISQRSICCVGSKLWNELPFDLKNYAQKIFVYLLNM